MPRAQEEDKNPILTREEWRARRELRREKQRKDNILRAAKMHEARLKIEKDSPKLPPRTEVINFCGMLGLALLEMAEFVLCRCAAARLV